MKENQNAKQQNPIVLTYLLHEAKSQSRI